MAEIGQIMFKGLNIKFPHIYKKITFHVKLKIYVMSVNEVRYEVIMKGHHNQTLYSIHTYK